MLDQLKWRAERDHALNRAGRRNVNVVKRSLSDIAFEIESAKASRHLGKRLVNLDKSMRLRIDKRDAGRHVRQDFFVEDRFALEFARRLQMAPIKPSAD